MAEFDEKAATWDDNPVRIHRAKVIAEQMAETIDLTKINTAMEYGSGTGLLSFALKDKVKSIVLMDESASMTEVAIEKCKSLGVTNLKPIQYNLLDQPMIESKFDLVFILLTLHHILDTDAILYKFKELLNENGYLVIMDLETEDGSFHEGEFHGHNGFDRQDLEKKIETIGLVPTSYEICYVLDNESDDEKEYPLFMLIAQKAT